MEENAHSILLGEDLGLAMAPGPEMAGLTAIAVDCRHTVVVEAVVEVEGIVVVVVVVVVGLGDCSVGFYWGGATFGRGIPLMLCRTSVF